MNRYLELGKPNRLTVVRIVDAGAVLASTEGKEVLLPNRYVPENAAVGDLLEVFVHTDSQDRFVAVTDRPAAMLGEAAVMEVVDTTKHGAFVDWGLAKDLFVPKSLQQEPLQIGDRPVVLVDYDNRTHRLTGTTKLDKKLARAKKSDLKRNQPVTLLLYARTPMGYKAVVEGRYAGLILHEELFCDDEPGDTLTADKVMTWLRSHDGMMPLNYKSDPESVRRLLGLSRKNFKRALSYLLEKGVIEVKENGTFLKVGSEKK